MGVLNLLTLGPDLYRQLKKRLPALPLPNWKYTLTALWLCIREGVLARNRSTACVCVCFAMRVCVHVHVTSFSIG